MRTFSVQTHPSSNRNTVSGEIREIAIAWQPWRDPRRRFLCFFVTLRLGHGHPCMLFGQRLAKGTRTAGKRYRNLHNLWRDLNFRGKWQTAFGSRRRGRIEVRDSCFRFLDLSLQPLVLAMVCVHDFNPRSGPQDSLDTTKWPISLTAYCYSSQCPTIWCQRW